MIGRIRVVVTLLALIGAGRLAGLPPDRAISQYVRRSWTVEQGLPHGTVRGFAQTADGYLWLATYEGLVRFNGEQFEIFEKGSAPEMLSDAIRVVCRTGNRLWLGTNDGLMRYDSGRFETIELPGGRDIIGALVDLPDGTIWVGTAGGRIIRIADGRPEQVSLALPAGPITALAATGDTVWIGTSAGLTRYRRATRETSPVEGLSSDRILTLVPDGADALLVGTATGVDRVQGNGIQQTVDHVGGVPADQITALRRDRHGNLWIGTYSHGLFRMSAGKLARYGIGDGLLNPTVRAIFEDDEGSIWIGSNGGLEQLRAGAFITWGKRDGLDDDFVRTIFEDHDGAMWAGSANGLYRWGNGGWEPGPMGPVGILSMAEGRDGRRWIGTSNGLYRFSGAETKLLTISDGLSNNTIRDIHEDRHGNVWLATDFGVNRIRPNGQIDSFAGRGGLGSAYAMAFAETPDGRLWVATGDGLGEYAGPEFTLHSAPRGLPSNRLFAIEADGEAGGTVWIATDGDGLIRYRHGKARVITASQGLATDKIVSLVDDGKGLLWFGALRGAFVVSKRELNAVADGTGSRVVSHLFDENDGLGSRQCNGAANPSAFRSGDGRIWLATAKGVSVLASGGTSPLPVRAPVVERVLINGKSVPPQSLQSIPPGVERIELEVSGVTFETPERIRFRYRLEGYDEGWIDGGTKRVASYTNLQAGEYRFLLASSRDGETWSSTSLPFTLQPRFYETRWFIAVSILAVAALLLALHNMRLHFSHERARRLETLVEERTRQISEEKERTEAALREAEAAKREAERHEKLVEQALEQAQSANRAKNIFLASTSHELRTPLNAIIGFSGILIETASDRIEPRHVRFLQNILSSGEYLLGHINNILDLSKIEAGHTKLEPEIVILHEVVEGICAVMKGAAMLRKVSIDVEIDSDDTSLEADPTHIKQILYNLISNAVKFSPESSSVTVSARHLPPAGSPLGESAVEIRVKDQGIGIDPKDHQLIFEEFQQAHGARGERPQGTGLGLTLVKRFVQMHRGTIQVESELGFGSTFIVILPRKYHSAVSGEESPHEGVVHYR